MNLVTKNSIFRGEIKRNNVYSIVIVTIFNI